MHCKITTCLEKVKPSILQKICLLLHVLEVHGVVEELLDACGITLLRPEVQ